MKRHRFDPFSFLFGAVFVTVGATFLFGASGSGHVRPVHVWPAAVVVVGLTLVLWAIGHALRPELAYPDRPSQATDVGSREVLESVGDLDEPVENSVAEADDAAPDAAASGATPEADDRESFD